jgi:hypothetical protein
MAQRSFLIRVHFLLPRRAHYRREFPIDLANERFLLILDVHSSRYIFEALNLLSFDVVVLASHCTHVVQPFDVSVAAPLKVKISAFCQDLRLTI